LTFTSLTDAPSLLNKLLAVIENPLLVLEVALASMDFLIVLPAKSVLF